MINRREILKYGIVYASSTFANSLVFTQAINSKSIGQFNHTQRLLRPIETIQHGDLLFPIDPLKRPVVSGMLNRKTSAKLDWNNTIKQCYLDLKGSQEKYYKKKYNEIYDIVIQNLLYPDAMWDWYFRGKTPNKKSPLSSNIPGVGHVGIFYKKNGKEYIIDANKSDSHSNRKDGVQSLEYSKWYRHHAKFHLFHGRLKFGFGRKGFK